MLLQTFILLISIFVCMYIYVIQYINSIIAYAYIDLAQTAPSVDFIALFLPSDEFTIKIPYRIMRNFA